MLPVHETEVIPKRRAAPLSPCFVGSKNLRVEPIWVFQTVSEGFFSETQFPAYSILGKWAFDILISEGKRHKKRAEVSRPQP
jgi:hypothetical protein